MVLSVLYVLFSFFINLMRKGLFFFLVYRWEYGVIEVLENYFKVI